MADDNDPEKQARTAPWPIAPDGKPETPEAVAAFTAFGKWAAKRGLLRSVEDDTDG